MNNKPGTFVISLDTELAWGTFDIGGISQRETAYRNTPEVIERLCDLFDEYSVPATWALVMHLLDDCESHPGSVNPQFEWVDWYDELPCNTGVDGKVWYSPNILEQIKSATVDHEIGLHGYTHMILGDSGCTPEAAQDEINRAIQIANSYGIEPETYIFPRNSIGHLNILRKSGISFYRGVDAYWHEEISNSAVQKPMRFINEALKRTPPVVTPRQTNDGLVEIPGSQLLRPLNGKWKYTRSDSQVMRAKKGLDQAAATGKVFHLWFHPFNLAVDMDCHLRMFEQILNYATELRNEGELEFKTIKKACEI